MHTKAKPQRGAINTKSIMAQSLSTVYVHITFSTKKRYPFIDDSVKQELWAYIGGIALY